ncbi:hypothetical protein HUJ04_011575 [Dendroctonus ponderosae]|nr:hypothetical protein HUJ04_011575 [Dendroctonus ponderosae]
MAAKRLLDLPKDEQLNFFNSFDTVLCDVDGVLWLLIGQIIERSPDGILALRKLGKKFYFITNNSLTPMDLYLQKMKDFEIAKEEVIRCTRTKRKMSNSKCICASQPSGAKKPEWEPPLRLAVTEKNRFTLP